MLATIVRTIVVGFGILLMVFGLLAIVSLPEIRLAALWWVALGGFLIVVVAAERQRYRSEAAERTNDSPGPGGGETSGAALDGRFRPTGEVFIDPTSGHRMRVLVDPSTGERRYVAEA